MINNSSLSIFADVAAPRILRQAAKWLKMSTAHRMFTGEPWLIEGLLYIVNILGNHGFYGGQ